MSAVSVARCVRDQQVQDSMRTLMREMALDTIADPALATACVARPAGITAVAMQALYVVVQVAAAKQAALEASIESSALTAPRRSLHGGVNGAAHTTQPAEVEFADAMRRVKAEATFASPSQVSVVLVGFGAVGTRIAEVLLNSGALHATALSVITRQPRCSTKLMGMGVQCYTQFPSATLSTADVVIVACQPGQFLRVADAMKASGSAAGKISLSASSWTSCLSPTCIVLSCMCGVAAEKVAAQLGHPLCLACSIDVPLIARGADAFNDEERILTRFQRLEASSAASLLPIMEFLSDHERAIVGDHHDNPQRRGLAHYASQLANAFPADPVVFFNRLLHALSVSAHQRGLKPAAVERLVTTLVVLRRASGSTRVQTGLEAAPGMVTAAPLRYTQSHGGGGGVETASKPVSGGYGGSAGQATTISLHSLAAGLGLASPVAVLPLIREAFGRTLAEVARQAVVLL